MQGIPAKKDVRTSVILTADQFNSLKAIAKEMDTSIAWVLRQAVDRYLSAAAPSAGAQRNQKTV